MPSLDETAIKVGGYRHTIAQKAVNVFRGEVYVYPFCNTFFIVTITGMGVHIICIQRYLLHEKLAISGKISLVNTGHGHVTRSIFFQEAMT